MKSEADIIARNASAAASEWLCREPLHHTDIERFNAVIFGRTYKKIVEAGGLWDTTKRIYPQLGAVARISDLHWRFPSGATVRLRHMQREDEWRVYQGMQAPVICYHHVEQFTAEQFWRTLMKNRSNCGVKPYARMTYSHDPDCFFAPMVDWWLDEDGHPIPECSGIIRYFSRIKEQVTWGDTLEELVEKGGPYHIGGVPGKDFQILSYHPFLSFTYVSD